MSARSDYRKFPSEYYRRSLGESQYRCRGDRYDLRLLSVPRSAAGRVPVGRPGHSPQPTYTNRPGSAYGGYVDAGYAGNGYDRGRAPAYNGYMTGGAASYGMLASSGYGYDYGQPASLQYGGSSYTSPAYANYSGYDQGAQYSNMNGYGTMQGVVGHHWGGSSAAAVPYTASQGWYSATPVAPQVSSMGAWQGRHSSPARNLMAPAQQMMDRFPRPAVTGGVYGSERLKRSTGSWEAPKKDDSQLTSRPYFSSFRSMEDICWFNDHTPDEEWPGTNKLKYGETYDGFIRYWMTPEHAVFIPVDKMAECCLVSDGMPAEMTVPSMRANFKVDHVLQAKLKWPQEFDDKGRPKVVMSFDRQSSPPAYDVDDLAWGTPVLIKDNIALLRLERGDHLAMLYISVLGVNLGIHRNYRFSNFLEKGERIQLLITRMPNSPRMPTYLAQVPWDSPKRLEWAERYPELRDNLAPCGVPGVQMTPTMFTPGGRPPPMGLQPAEFTAPGFPPPGAFHLDLDTSGPCTFATSDVHELLPTSSEPQSISEFTHKIGGRLKDVLRFLFMQTRSPVDPNANLTVNLAKRVYNFVTGRTEFNDIDDYACEDELKLLKGSRVVTTLDRPPIVVLMGHINHGKTSLFDMLTESRNIESEAGQITQVVRTAMLKGDSPMTLIDTPGHEVFDAMRRCGATIADIALVVVDATEGLKPQTRESIKLCKDLGIPFIVAATKCDLPNAHQSAEDLAVQLSEEGVIIEALGGDVQFLQVSSKADTDSSRHSILSAIQLQSAASDETVHSETPGVIGRGFVLESGRGPRSSAYCLAILKQGSMSKGSYFGSGKSSVKINGLKSPAGKRVASAKPSQAVFVEGFEDGVLPTPGDSFVIYSDEKHAESLAELNMDNDLEQEADSVLRRGLTEGLNSLEDHQVGDPTLKRIPAVLKSSTQGSVDALRSAIGAIKVHGMLSTGVYEVIDASTGPIYKSDVQSASETGAIIIGLDSSLRSDAKLEARKLNVAVISSDVIYDIVKQAHGALSDRLGDRVLTEFYGRARVLKVFDAIKNSKAAGCVVASGRIPKSSAVRVLRNGIPVYAGTLASLRHTTDSTEEAVEAQSCGMTFEGWNDVQVDDVVEAYSP